MSEVLIISMSKEQLDALFMEKIEAARNRLSAADSEYRKIYSHQVDRNYLRKNFKWGKTRIERFEAEGKLRPVYTGDAKTHYYTLSDCIQLDIELRG